MLIPLVVIGTGAHAREALDVVEARNRVAPRYEVIGLLDEDTSTHASRIRGYPVLGLVRWLASAPSDVRYFIGIGACPARARTARDLAPLPNRAETLIHPHTSIGTGCAIGPGCLIAPGAVITTNVRLGAHTHMNTAASISHDCALGDFVHLAPGVHVAGNVRIGDGCDVGVGASVIQGIGIGEWSVIGAGAAVIRPVDANVTVAGVPAREIARRTPGWWAGR
jgi:sugar O-acyltransferase (sialic acid O-acetyltransferase NeuD family)